MALTWTFCPPSANAAAWDVESYGEFVSLENEGGYQSSVWSHVRYHVGGSRWIPTPYVGVAWDRYAPDAFQSSRLSPLVGLELWFVPWMKFVAEYRYAIDSPPLPYSHSDPRVGFIGGYWHEFAQRPAASLFVDSYGEFLLIPRISDHAELTAFAKGGPRFLVAKGLSADLFAEAFAHDSDDIDLGRRAAELRYGARAVISLPVPRGHDSWILTVMGFRRFLTFRDAPEARWRLLFAIGGRL